MIWIGTSGFNYPEWKGSFYPRDLPAAKMLPYYASRFATVEINYTFYRMPTERLLVGWAQATPDSFKFTLKAPRRITHDLRLQNCEPLVRTFCEVASVLGSRLGILLFQLPPSMKKALATLDAFLCTLPPGARPAFEFRHPSWHEPDVFDRLQARNAALCIAESPKLSTPLVETADFGYLRLRDEDYIAADLDRWAEMIERRQDRWRDTFVYFKHEEQGKGPELADALSERLRGRGQL